MKITARQADGLVQAPPADLLAILLYGREEAAGVIADRARTAIRSQLGPQPDPFALVALRADDVGAEPGRLADEVSSPSLLGGRRVIHITGAGDRLVPALKLALEGPAADCLLVIEAGDLAPRAALRKLAEGHERVASIGCYVDEGRQRRDLIRDALRESNQRLEGDAETLLLDMLPADRLLARQELAKLTLYALDQPRITGEDVQAALTNGAASNQDQWLVAVFDGDTAAACRLLDSLLADGLDGVPLTRALARHGLRLAEAQAHGAAGKTADQAMKGLSPPVHFKIEDGFRRQMQRLGGRRLGRMLDRITQAEAALKRTGVVGPVEMGALTLDLCAMAGARRGG